LDEDKFREAFGERKTLKDWLKDPRCVVTYHALQQRVLKGMPVEQAMTRPLSTRNLPGPRDERQWKAFGELKTVAQWARDPRCMVGRDTLLRQLQPSETSVASRMADRAGDFGGSGDRASQRRGVR
jgi:hypothetical protein